MPRTQSDEVIIGNIQKVAFLHHNGAGSVTGPSPFDFESMFSSDFQCLARAAYESSDDTHEGNDDSIFERSDSISPPPRSPLLQNRDISKFSRIGGDMEYADLDETRWNSRRFSLNHDSKPTTTNSSIHNSTPRYVGQYLLQSLKLFTLPFLTYLLIIHT